jgi:pyruvate dehydrogenase E2 component (dihydrolipoamide acetyltransferase)
VAARLVVAVLRRHPHLNARATPEGAELVEAVNLGVAVDTDEGLVVPVVRHADHLNLDSLAARLRALVTACRSHSLSPADLEQGTFTITNLGAYQVDFGTPVLNWPQVAILGLGRISADPTGQPQIGLSLTVDHRLIDGVPAARFLDDVAYAFDHPDSALL